VIVCRQRQAKEASAFNEPLLRSAAHEAAVHASTVDVAPTAETVPERDAAQTGISGCALLYAGHVV